jgi:hypothetical protein
MQPFRWAVSQPQNHYTVQLTEIAVNQPLEDSRFTKPETPPQHSEAH